MISTQQFRVCDVHRLVDYDCIERNCFYCGMCDAWICDECAPKWGKRIKAAIKRKLEPGFTGDPGYSDKIENELKAKGDQML